MNHCPWPLQATRQFLFFQAAGNQIKPARYPNAFAICAQLIQIGMSSRGAASSTRPRTKCVLSSLLPNGLAEGGIEQDQPSMELG